MPDYRSLPYGAVLPPDFLEALQQFIGSGAYNFKLSIVGTSVQVNAGPGNDQVGLGIGGLWRYITASVNTAVTGGAGGVHDICAVTGPNSFTGMPEVDSTNYAFTLQAPAIGVPPTVPTGGAYRKVGEVDWSGTAITALRQMVGFPAVDGLAGSPTLRTLGTGAQQAAAGSDARLTNARAPVAHAASHRYDGSDPLLRPRRRTQTWALDSTTVPVVSASQQVTGFPISLAIGETATLVGAYVQSTSGSGSVFKIMYDHGVHGVYSDVPGLTALTPANAGFVLTAATGGPLALAEGDGIVIVCVTPGSSLGVKISVVTEYTS